MGCQCSGHPRIIKNVLSYEGGINFYVKIVNILEILSYYRWDLQNIVSFLGYKNTDFKTLAKPTLW